MPGLAIVTKTTKLNINLTPGGGTPMYIIPSISEDSEKGYS